MRINRDRPLDFEEASAVLTRTLGGLGRDLDFLGLKGDLGTLERLVERVSHSTFRVLVVGEYKTGKSTFLNALLRRVVLPMDVVPCTGVVAEIVHSKTPRIEVHFNEPLPPYYSANLPSDLRKHLETAQRVRGIPPWEPTVRDETELVTRLEQLTTIEGGKKLRQLVRKVRLGTPLAHLCNERTELVDSPGLNEDPSRTAQTLNYLESADCVVFLLDAQRLLSISEKAAVDQIHAAKHRDIHFVVNKFDVVGGAAAELARLQGKAAELEKIRQPVCQRAWDQLTPLTGLGMSGIHFVSGAEALLGTMSNNMARLSDSGMPGFESGLRSYLGSGRLQFIKIKNAATKGLELANAASKSLEDQHARASKSQHDDIAKIRLRAQALETIVKRVQHFRTDMKRATEEVLLAIRSNTADFYGTELPVAVRRALLAHRPKVEVEILRSKETSEALARELSDVASAVIRMQNAEFVRTQERTAQSKLGSLDEQFLSIVRDIHAFRGTIFADVSPEPAPSTANFEFKVWDSVASPAVLGILGASIALILIGLGVSPILGGVLALAFVAVMGGDGLTRHVQEKIVEGVVKGIEAKRSEGQTAFMSIIRDKLEARAQANAERLEDQVKNVSGEAERLQEGLSKGQVYLDGLSACRSRLNEIELTFTQMKATATVELTAN